MRGVVVASALLRLVHQNGVSGKYLHLVITGAGVNPNRLLHRRSDRNLVVAIQRINDDGQEVAFRRQQGTDQLALEEIYSAERVAAGLISARVEQRVEVALDILRVPDEVACRIRS